MNAEILKMIREMELAHLDHILAQEPARGRKVYTEIHISIPLATEVGISIPTNYSHDTVLVQSIWNAETRKPESSIVYAYAGQEKFPIATLPVR